MKTSSKGLTFLKFRETSDGKPILTAYQNKNDKVTIGYGLTKYPNGTPVKLGDRYTSVAQADKDFKDFVSVNVETPLNNALTKYGVKLNQNQFDALVSYCFNRSVGALLNTTLWSAIVKNPNAPQIAIEFVNNWGSNVTYKDSLQARRRLEAKYYFSNDALSFEPQKENVIDWFTIILGLAVLGYFFKGHIKNFLNRFINE